ncbi:MAG: lamin tail domain-containing protein [Tepidiformaceae bacterium]
MVRAHAGPSRLLAAVLIAAVLVARVPQSASALELLSNGGFETWSGGAPDGWLAGNGTSVVQSTSVVDSGGSSARLRRAGIARISQGASAAAGGAYAASIRVAGGDGATTAILWLEFRDASGFLLNQVASEAVTLTAGFITLAADGVAPPATASAWVVLALEAQVGDATGYADGASLVETAPPPTPTASATATATAIATAPPPTVPATATSTRTQPPQGTPPPTPAATATPAGPLATATPLAAEFGGLLRNGNFEQEEDGRPAFGSKFGGTMGLTAAAYRELRAVTLSSETTSTKWVQQGAPAAADTWYVASGWVRVTQGNAEAFIRLSWYDDGNGTGAALGNYDSAVVTSGGWSGVSAGPVAAPAGAASVRVKLMLRSGPGAAVAFDDVALYESVPPAPSATTTPSSAAPATAVAATGTASATPPRATATPRPPGAAPAGGGGAGAGTGGPTVSRVLTVEGPHGLRLSEVMSDPAATGIDSAHEWVELVNTGMSPVDTAGWQLGDAREVDELPAAIVAPGGYIVVAGKLAEFAPGAPVLRPADGTIGGGLNNAGDFVRLVAPDGTEVDSLSYGDNTSVFEPAPPAPPAGGTIGVRVAGADPAAENWSITSRPTPGEPNIFAAPAARTPAGRSLAGDAGESDSQELGESASLGHEGGGSPLPWIMLAGAVGAGLTGAAFAGWPPVRRRLKRDG